MCLLQIRSFGANPYSWANPYSRASPYYNILEKRGYIGLSENGWTDNELGLEWFKQCFNTETKPIRDEYRILIVDGHASHITTAAIKFCIDQKIIVFCLPPHSTHLLQPLDVAIFRQLALSYKQGLSNRGFLNPSYSIDKLDFLEIYLKAREAITPIRIERAWLEAGLEPFNPIEVLRQIPGWNVRSVTPNLSFTNGFGESIQVPITPGNVIEIERLFSKVIQGNNLNPDTLECLKKL